MEPITTQPQNLNTPEIVPSHKHFVNKKFILTFASLILLGIVAYAGIWYWQKQSSSVPVSTFTPRPTPVDPTADWKTYTNTEWGFEFKYPKTWVSATYQFGKLLEVAVDPAKVASQNDLEAVDIPAGLISVIVEKCAVKMGCHAIGYASFEGEMIGDQKLIEARKLEIINGNNTSNPAYQGKHIITYHIDYGTDNEYRATINYVSDVDDKNLTDFRQILSTFKFTDSTADWKTYTNAKYGYGFRYPSGWNAMTSKFDDGRALFGPSATNSTGFGGVERLGSLSSGQTLEMFVAAFNRGIEGGSTSETEATIGDQSVIVSILPKAGGGQFKSVAFSNGKDVFGVYITDTSDLNEASRFDKVLSTFKFAKQ